MYQHRKTEALYSQLSSSTKTRVAQALQSSLQSLLRATHRPKFLYSLMWVVLVHGHSDLLHALSSTSTFCCGFVCCSAVSEAAGVATGGCDTGLAVLVPMALALWQELAYLGAQVDPQRPLVELAAQKPLAQAGSVVQRH